MGKPFGAWTLARSVPGEGAGSRVFSVGHPTQFLFLLQRKQQSSSCSTLTVPVCSGTPAPASLMATASGWVRTLVMGERTTVWLKEHDEGGGDSSPLVTCLVKIRETELWEGRYMRENHN